MTDIRDVYSRITDKIVADLDKGVRPWMRPWSAGNTDGRIVRPLRHNGIPYKGINVLMLWSASIVKESMRMSGVSGASRPDGRQSDWMKRRPKSPGSEEKSAVPAAEDVSAILQVKVWLLDISPMVWRRLLLPSSYTLRELHGVIQVAMGWEGSGDDLPEEVAAELEAREEAWQPEDLAIGGVILTIAVDGSLRIDRGYVRAEDEPVTPAQDGTEAADGTAEADSGSTVMPFRPAPEPEDKAPALSATLLAELEVHRTAGLQAALAWHPELALRVMVHALATDALYSRYGETVVGLAHLPPCPRRCLPRNCRQPGAADPVRGRRRMAHPAAPRARSILGMAAGPGRANLVELDGRLCGARHECRTAGLDHVGRQPEHRCPGGNGGRAGHADMLDCEQGQLSRPGVESPDRGGRTRGRRDAGGRADYRQQEGSHGSRRRAASGRNRLASFHPTRCGNEISRGLCRR
jgi:hypothetical protein